MLTGMSWPRSCQSLQAYSDFSSISSVSSRIMPRSSIAGTKLTGDSTPSAGCCQRASASAAITLRLAISTMGWNQGMS